METQSLPNTPRIVSTVQVSTTDELADVLMDASARSSPVIPVGGGTSLHIGNVTTDEYIAIDTRGMRGVREYHPTDLTASFRAGTTLAEVRATLAEHGQELPVDMVHEEAATMGGMVATGFAGPRRLGSGTLKDLIIGAEYVRGDGLAAKAGGMLVKNVSGFEIPRFLHGSWGALAVIAAINLKVIPKPKADVTFVHTESTLDRALAGQLSLIRSHPGVMAIVSEKQASGWATMVRLMGRQSSVAAQLGTLRDAPGGHTDSVEGDTLWRGFNERWADKDGPVRLIIGGRAEAIRVLAVELDAVSGVVGMAVSLGTGTLRVAVDPALVPRDELTSRLQRHGVTWTIESAPSSWKGRESVWGPERADSALARSIKQQFDPASILNRGRLFV